MVLGYKNPSRKLFLATVLYAGNHHKNSHEMPRSHRILVTPPPFLNIDVECRSFTKHCLINNQYQSKDPVPFFVRAGYISTEILDR